jgi:hypothetical protein
MVDRDLAWSLKLPFIQLASPDGIAFLNKLSSLVMKVK